MTRRRHRCDVPGCDRDRKRWQRLCEPCFASLPADIRTGLIHAWHHDRKAHRAWARKAGAFMAERTAARPRIDPRTTYERTARLLGER